MSTKKLSFPSPLDVRRRQVTERQIRDILQYIEDRIPEAIKDLNHVLMGDFRVKHVLDNDIAFSWTSVYQGRVDPDKLVILEEAIKVIKQAGWNVKFVVRGESVEVLVSPDVEWLKKNDERFKKHAKAEGQDNAK